MSLNTKKKLQRVLSIFCAAFLVSGLALILPTAAPQAFASSAITFSSPNVQNGQAQTVTFGTTPYTIPLTQTSGGTQQVLCFYRDGYFNNTQLFTNEYNGGDVVPTSVEISAGTINNWINENTKSVNRTFTWAWIDVVKLGTGNPTCNDLPQDFSSFPFTTNTSLVLTSATVSQSASYEVTPALNSPLSQTIYLNENNTTPATVTGSYFLEAAKIANNTSDWENKFLDSCDPNAPNSRIDLSTLGLTLDATLSPAGQIAPLLISGIPNSNSVGTHTLCLLLDSGTDLKTTFILTIAAERPAPALPATGLSGDQQATTLTIGAIAIVLGGLGLIVRRRLWNN
jgi:hypothetical protein